MLDVLIDRVHDRIVAEAAGTQHGGPWPGLRKLLQVLVNRAYREGARSRLLKLQLEHIFADVENPETLTFEEVLRRAD